MLKRTFDIVSSLLVLLIGMPFFLIVAVWIALESPGGPFFVQERVGRKGRHFGLFKFRSMRKVDSDELRVTVGKDPRITRSGAFIRKFKIDEFPQLINVIKGDMSIVGPRPEVPEFVECYTPEQMRVLDVRPGLTDFASIEYMDESEILAGAQDPREAYVKQVLPKKLELQLEYVDQQSFSLDMKLIFRTLGKILD